MIRALPYLSCDETIMNIVVIIYGCTFVCNLVGHLTLFIKCYTSKRRPVLKSAGKQLSKTILKLSLSYVLM